MREPRARAWTSHPEELPASRALRYGDGVFVTMSVHEGVLLDAERQVERILAAAESIGLLPPAGWNNPSASLLRLLDILRELAPTPDHVVRLQWHAGIGERGFGRPPAPARVLVDVGYPPAPRRPSVAVLADGLVPLPAFPRHKTCSALANVVCADRARIAGVDAAVRVMNGTVLETDSANLFWLWEGRLFTPGAGLPLYAGTVRARVIECAPSAGLHVEQDEFSPRDLVGAEAVLLTNSVRGVECARSVDGVVLPDPPRVIEELSRTVHRRRAEHGRSLEGGLVDA